MDMGVWRYLQNDNQGWACTFLFVVWLQKGYQMEVFQENGLFGARNQNGIVIIPPQYIEMQPFCCGLSLVRNRQYQYAYIDILNRQIVPFGKYIWCDYNRQNEKCNFEKRKVHFLVFSGHFGRVCLTAVQSSLKRCLIG